MIEISLGNLRLEVLDELVTLLVHKPEDKFGHNLSLPRKEWSSPQDNLGQTISLAAEEVLHLDIEPLHIYVHVRVLHNPQLAADNVHLGHTRDGGASEGGCVRGWRQVLVQLKWAQDTPEDISI